MVSVRTMVMSRSILIGVAGLGGAGTVTGDR